MDLLRRSVYIDDDALREENDDGLVTLIDGMEGAMNNITTIYEQNTYCERNVPLTWRRTKGSRIRNGHGTGNGYGA